MEPHTKESTRHIEIVLKALDVLDCFDTEPGLSLKQIIDRTGLHRSRTMRITGTLVSKGYLFFDPRTDNYTLGSRLLALGNAFQRNNSLLSIVRPILKHLVEKTGESSTFSILEANKTVVLAREEGTHAIRYSVREGKRTPLYAGAASKILLAFGNEDVLERIIEKNLLQPITQNTITDPGLLKKELHKIREQGFALSSGENTPEARAVAAPVFDRSDHLLGALSVSGPSNRVKGTLLSNLRDQVIDASIMLSKALGYNPKNNSPVKKSAPRQAVTR